MTDDPQRRFERDLTLDPSISSPAREGLTGTAPQSLYAEGADGHGITLAPDGRPMSTQPTWRHDFPIDGPADQYVARRDFAKFLVLTSGAFAVGQGWIATKSLLRHRREPPPRLKIGSLATLAVGSASVFSYPDEHAPCLLLRPETDVVLAFSQSCTHLACAVVPRMEEGVLHCPCHEGYFDLHSGRNIAGPPPRPLPRIELELDGDDIYAIGILQTMV
jgi:Rieske Fe-S protein